MKKSAKSYYSLLLLFLIFSLFTYICFSSFTQLWISNNYYKEKSRSIRFAQDNNNFTVDSVYPKLIWTECRISVIFTSNISGNITIFLQESSGGNYFSVANELIDLDESNQSYSVELTSRPQLFTLPGNYEFSLDITGVFIFNETFNVILGMGYSVLLLTYLVLLIAIPIILTRKEEETTELPPSEAISAPPSQIDTSAPEGKIKCPECRKEIDEGLTFCPECGARIPEFLKFNPS